MFNIKTSAGQAHEIKVKKILKDSKKAAWDPDVAIDKIFNELCLTATGRKTSYTPVVGISKMLLCQNGT